VYELKYSKNRDIYYKRIRAALEKLDKREIHMMQKNFMLNYLKKI